MSSESAWNSTSVVRTGGGAAGNSRSVPWTPGPPGSPLPSRALRHAASAAFAASSARRAASARPRISAWRRSSAARAASRATRAASRRDSSSARRAASARSAPERACHSSGAEDLHQARVLQRAEQRRLRRRERLGGAELAQRGEEGALVGAAEEGLGGGQVTAADPRGPRDRRERLEGGPHRTGAAHAGEGDLHQRRHEAGLLGQERHPPHRGERAQLGGRGGVHSRRLVDPRRIRQLPARPERVQHRRDERPGGEQRLRVGLVSEAETGADQIPELDVELRLAAAAEEREPAGALVLVRAEERLGRGRKGGRSHLSGNV